MKKEKDDRNDGKRKIDKGLLIFENQLFKEKREREDKKGKEEMWSHGKPCKL